MEFIFVCTFVLLFHEVKFVDSSEDVRKSMHAEHTLTCLYVKIR